MKESSSKSPIAGQEGKNPCKKHMVTYCKVENQLKNLLGGGRILQTDSNQKL